MGPTSSQSRETAIRTYFLIVGIICLTFAVWLLVRRLQVLFAGVPAVGHVRAHEAREMDESTSYLPVVTFRDANGREHRFTSVAGGPTRRPEVGDEVRVLYLPANPRRAYIDSFLHMWAAPVALAVLGMAGIGLLWTR